MNILITGHTGFIGNEIFNYLKSNHHVYVISRSIGVDLTNIYDMRQFFEKNKIMFDVVIHCSVIGGNKKIIYDEDVYQKNIQMIENLLIFKDRFKKIITFSSGAEFDYNINNLYGKSKRYITNRLNTISNSYILRIYNCFGINELSRRFIKSIITNYINNKDIIIHQNKKMDFFYIHDLLIVIEYLINNNSIIKEFEMCYKNKYYLSEIAEYVNNLNMNNKVNIIIENLNPTDDYISMIYNLPIYNTIGLFDGIKNIYQQLNKIKTEQMDLL